MELLRECAIQHVKPDGANYAGAAGTTDLTSDVIDMAGFENCAILITFGDNADTATCDISIKQSDDSGGSPDVFSDVASSKIAVVCGASDTDHKMVGYQLNKVKKRYLQLFFDRGTANSVIAHCVAVKHNGRTAPFTQSTAAGHFLATGIKVLTEPVEGTA